MHMSHRLCWSLDESLTVTVHDRCYRQRGYLLSVLVEGALGREGDESLTVTVHGLPDLDLVVAVAGSDGFLRTCCRGSTLTLQAFTKQS